MNKVLIIGYGDIAKRHFKNINFLLGKSKFLFLLKKKKKYNIKNIQFTSSIKLAYQFEPNITIICSPATSHLYYANMFSKISSNIYIEKPVALNEVELKKYIKKFEKKKFTIQDGYNLRFDESLNFFKKKIKTNILGKILSVKSEVGQYLPNWRKRKYSNTVSAKKKLGGGVINELSHDIDILFMLFQNIKLITAINYKISNLHIDTEDTCHAIFKSKYLKNSFYIFMHMDFYRHDKTRECTIIGSKATIQWDGIAKTVKIIKKNSKIEIFKFKKNNNLSYINSMKFFLYSINKKKNLFKQFKKNLSLINILTKLKNSKCSV